MKIELKNIKHSEFASQETNCYEASIYIDGKRVGHVSNNGHGGSDFWYAVGKSDGDRTTNEAKLQAAQSWLKDQPKIQSDFDDFEYSQDLETKCGELLTDWLITRDVKKALKRTICFVKPSQKGIFEFKKTKPTQSNIEAVAAKNPTYIILNTLTVAEAVQAWQEAGA